MEEPHIIGIRLMLDDGISAGLASIQPDLDRVDHAIIAAGLAVRGSAGDVVPVPQPTPRRVRGAVVSPPDLPPSAVIVSQRPPPRQPDAQRQAERATALATPAQPSALGATPGVSPLSPARTSSTVAGRSLPNQALHRGALGPAADIQRPLVQPAGSPHSATIAFALRAHSAVPASAKSATSPTQSTVAQVQRGNVPATSTAAIAPSRQPQQAEPEPGPPLPPQSATSGSSNSVPGDPASQSQEGSLLLDGAMLGRWVIDHLTREIDRPASAGTSVDPRMGRSWPGSLQGA